MSSQTYHHNKKTGAIYVYSVNSYWDKVKKRPANKQVCLGKLDKETGELIPSKRARGVAKRAASSPEVTATTLVVGPYILLEKLTEQLGLNAMLKKCFPELHTAILSMVYFIVQKGLALSHCEQWSAGHLHPFGEIMISQRISELLPRITENDRQRFLSLWLSKMVENDYLCYDITSVSSYAKNNEYVKYGYNRDKESLPQINLAMLFGQISRLPAYYRRMPGNITDVATLKTTMQSLNFLGSAGINFVLDRGFYSESNINELFKRKHKFTIAIPSGRKWVEKIIDRYYENIQSPANYLQLDDDEALYVKTVLYKWGEHGKRSYLHIYYNAKQAAEEFDGFTRALLKYKNELISGDKIKEHEEYYERYFIIKETPKRGIKVLFNDAEIEKHRKRYAGFFCIFSNAVKAPLTALNIYRTKDVVENSFDDLKNQLDMKRLRTHTSGAMDARMFLQFLALIYICQIRNTIQDDRILKNLTVREIMGEMETLARIKYSHRYGQLYTETNPTQRKIMSAFGVVIPA
jgi:transposase